MNGNVSNFASMSLPKHEPMFIAEDITGNYDGLLYTGTSGQDHIYSINQNGSVSMFSAWPNLVDGGGPFGIAFDPSGKFGAKMYIASGFIESQSQYSGVFTIDTNGNTSRFADGIVRATYIGFDPTGKYFDNDMFVWGTSAYNKDYSLWRIKPDGTCIEFASGIRDFAFGNDGTLYIAEYSWALDTVTISTVIPEPCTIAMLGAGLIWLKKRK